MEEKNNEGDREDRILLGREKRVDRGDRMWVGGEERAKNKEDSGWRRMKRQ